GDIDRIFEIGPAKCIVAVGDDDYDAAAGYISQLFVGKLPYGVKEGCLRTSLFDLIDRFLQKIELVSKILSEDDLVIKGHKGGLVFTQLDDRIEKICRGLF